MRIRTLALAATAAFVLLVPVALAKEGAQAHLLAPLPAHPLAGTLITIRWTVDVPGTGRRAPFRADGMFVRLIGRDATTTATAQSSGPPYSARIRVPRGGIRAIRFGLHGMSCQGSECRRSDIYFTLR